MRWPKAYLNKLKTDAPLVAAERTKPVEAEKAMCRRFVKLLAGLRACKKADHLWWLDYRHIANERAGNRQKQLTYMGVQKGDLDYQFNWVLLETISEMRPVGTPKKVRPYQAWIEFKFYRGNKAIRDVTHEERLRLLTPEQHDKYNELVKAGIPVAICLSEHEAISQLIEWGTLKA